MIDTQVIPVRIQILAVKEEAGVTAHAVAAAEKGRTELTEIAGRHGAEALLVCPAPDGFVEDGFDLVVAARFGEPLDEEASVMRELDLSAAISHALRVRAVTLDLDGPVGPFPQLYRSDARIALSRRDRPAFVPIRTA